MGAFRVAKSVGARSAARIAGFRALGSCFRVADAPRDWRPSLRGIGVVVCIVPAVVLGQDSNPPGPRVIQPPPSAAGVEPGAADEAGPADPVALYNSGCRAIEDGEHAKAIDLFRRADTATTRPRLAADARFNAGHAAFKQALSTVETNPEQAIELLRASAAAYRASLDLRPGDGDAARSLEAARRALARLLDEKKKQEEQQQQQQQQQEHQRQQDSDQLQQLAEKQREIADRASELARGDHQSPETRPQREQLEQEQKSLNEETRRAQERMKQRQQDQSSQEAKERLEEATKEQQSAAESLDKNELRPASESAQRAADQLRRAAEAMKKPPGQKPRDQPPEGEQPQDQPQQPQPDEREQTQAPRDPDQELVEAILDREQRQRQARERARQVQMRAITPVEKDW